MRPVSVTPSATSRSTNSCIIQSNTPAFPHQHIVSGPSPIALSSPDYVKGELYEFPHHQLEMAETELFEACGVVRPAAAGPPAASAHGGMKEMGLGSRSVPDLDIADMSADLACAFDPSALGFGDLNKGGLRKRKASYMQQEGVLGEPIHKRLRALSATAQGPVEARDSPLDIAWLNDNEFMGEFFKDDPAMAHILAEFRGESVTVVGGGASALYAHASAAELAAPQVEKIVENAICAAAAEEEPQKASTTEATGLTKTQQMKIKGTAAHAERRARNNEAVRRCRENRAKKNKESEQRCRELRKENGELRAQVAELRAQVSEMKKVVLKHMEQRLK